MTSGPDLRLEQRALLDWLARALAGRPLVPLITVVGDAEGKVGLLFSRHWLETRLGADPARKAALLAALTDQFRRLLEGEGGPSPSID